MATTLNFDELNRLDYKQYFGKMFITPQQMQKRIDLARDIEDVMLYLFAYWVIAKDADIPKAELVQDVEAKLTEAVEKHMKLDPYIQKHISKTVNEIVDATERQTKKRKEQELNEFLEDSSDEDEVEELEKSGFDWEDDEESAEDEQEYWLSEARAMLISANEANSFENYQEYREAKEAGKTHKRWRTILDTKVRLDHLDAEGQLVEINSPFLIGGYQMMFPHDESLGAPPQETINCRCSVSYE